MYENQKWFVWIHSTNMFHIGQTVGGCLELNLVILAAVLQTEKRKEEKGREQYFIIELMKK